MADDPQLPLDGAPSGGNPPPISSAPSVAFADLTAAGIPDTYIKDGAFDAKGVAASLTELGTLKQQAAERAAGIPQDGKYKFDLPQDFKVPEGFQWNPDATFTAQISELAKAEGLTQGQISKLTAAYAAQDLAKKTAASAASKADDDAVETEAKKLLGDAYIDRTANVRQAMQGIFGEQLAKNISFQGAADIIAMEKFINESKSRMAPNTQHGGAPSNSHAAELVGTKDGGMKLMNLHYSAKP